ncbi:MAG: hypothetical protein KGL39_16600 [Patescibacteria group bacterium]|nr:hypothetical protein [Patescibacteria group bacterium]
MTKRADTQVIEVNDPGCQGVTSSDGRFAYPKDRQGRIELPRTEARKILASGHRDTRAYRPVFALGGVLHPEPDVEVTEDPIIQLAKRALGVKE